MTKQLTDRERAEAYCVDVLQWDKHPENELGRNQFETLLKYFDKVRREERERCAEVVKKFMCENSNYACCGCNEAIAKAIMEGEKK